MSPAAPVRNPRLEELFAGEVRCSTQRQPRGAADLFPTEAALVRGSAPCRVDEFAGARRCARAALAALGAQPTPIGRGPHGEPLFPAGYLGTLSHSDGIAVAAVAARSSGLRAIGIDVEPHAPLPPGLAQEILVGEEQEMVRCAGRDRPETAWDRLVFCAKEATYKAWHHFGGGWLDFRDGKVQVDPVRQLCTTTLVPSALTDPATPRVFSGAWRVLEGYLFVSAFVPGGPAQPR